MDSGNNTFNSRGTGKNSVTLLHGIGKDIKRLRTSYILHTEHDSSHIHIPNGPSTDVEQVHRRSNSTQENGASPNRTTESTVVSLPSTADDGAKSILTRPQLPRDKNGEDQSDSNVESDIDNGRKDSTAVSKSDIEAATSLEQLQPLRNRLNMLLERVEHKLEQETNFIHDTKSDNKTKVELSESDIDAASSTMQQLYAQHELKMLLQDVEHRISYEWYKKYQSDSNIESDIDNGRKDSTAVSKSDIEAATSLEQLQPLRNRLNMLLERVEHKLEQETNFIHDTKSDNKTKVELSESGIDAASSTVQQLYAQHELKILLLVIEHRISHEWYKKALREHGDASMIDVTQATESHGCSGRANKRKSYDKGMRNGTTNADKKRKTIYNALKDDGFEADSQQILQELENDTLSMDTEQPQNLILANHHIKERTMLNKDIWSDATKEHRPRAQVKSSSSTAKSEAIIHEHGSAEANSRREPKQVPTLNLNTLQQIQRNSQQEAIHSGRTMITVKPSQISDQPETKAICRPLNINIIRNVSEHQKLEASDLATQVYQFGTRVSKRFFLEKLSGKTHLVAGIVTAFGKLNFSQSVVFYVRPCSPHRQVSHSTDAKERMYKIIYTDSNWEWLDEKIVDVIVVDEAN